MKLKYYLRGLGIGIVVTALLMGVADKNEATAKTQTTQEITAETVQEEQTQSELSAEDSKQNVSIEEFTEPVEEETEMLSEDNMTDHATENAEISLTQSMTDTEEHIEEERKIPSSSKQEEETQEITQPETLAAQMEAASGSSRTVTDEAQTDSVTLSIVRGDDSGTVSRKLQNAGLIDNASEFDAYLMQHGYDKKISIGSVEIPKGATWLEIAELLSRKK